MITKNKTLLGQLLFLVCTIAILTGCAQTRLRQMEVTVRDVQMGLYTPQDAVMLDQFFDGGHKEFVAPDCTIAYLETAYGVNQPIETIVNEYSDKLLSEDWELNPLYEPSKTDSRIYLRRGSQMELVIYSFADPGGAPYTSPLTDDTQFVTVYVVILTYSEPSTLDCSI